MRKFSIFYLLFTFVILSCNTSKEEKTSCSKSDETKQASTDKNFEMYEMSELATLMEQMYVDNKRLKERIEKGEEVGEFPEYFAKIHNAIMTDPSENDTFFKEQAASFIKNQKLIYTDSKNAKEHYSNAIQSCVACHEVKCSGPISRIKKLELKSS